MTRRSDKRMRLILAANRLIHRKGYERTSIAEIAKEAAVPPGNVYYYFKTKEELVDAMIARRNAFISAWLSDIDKDGDPELKLTRFVDEFEKTSKSRAEHGCPVGGLCHDANRIGGTFADQAGAAFRTLLEWLARQFVELGDDQERAKANALHLFSVLEGATLFAHTFREPGIVEAESARLKAWLVSLATSQQP